MRFVSFVLRRFFVPCLAVLLLASCAGPADERPVWLKASDFDSLPGWNNDRVEGALLPLARSCGKRLKRDPAESVGPGGFAGKAGDWQGVCREAIGLLFEPGAARSFFERSFVPYEVRAGRFGDEGLFTGYYEPELKAARQRKEGYAAALYAAPSDLITADLGQFHPDLSGRKITGRVKDGKLHPSETRAEIAAGALEGQGLELAYAADPVDAFFLQVQGSGRLDLDDGGVMRLGFAAQNGHSYVAIGRELIALGALEKENVSLQSIRAWLAAHPEKAQEIMNKNPSFVFFRELPDMGGPLGAEGLPLTAGRSLAVDRRKMPYGVPFFLDAAAPEGGDKERLQRLMLAQDTGGAIRGAVRGDVFWGFGPAAEAAAGVMKSPGRFWILLPLGVEVPKTALLPGWWP